MADGTKRTYSYDLNSIEEDFINMLKAEDRKQNEEKEKHTQLVYEELMSAKPLPLDDFIIKDGLAVRYEGQSKIVAFPDGIVEIDRKVLPELHVFEGIRIPSSVKKIGRKAFENCYWLEVVIVDGAEEIGSDAFMGCYNLKKIILPGNLKRIGESAFRACSNLVDIDIPSGIKEIGENAFFGCQKLNAEIIPDCLKNDKYNGYCAELGLSKENGCIIRGKELVGYNGDPANIVIDEGVEIIREGALTHSFRNLEICTPCKVTLPATLKCFYESEINYYRTCMPMPKGYLRQRTKLPSEFTYKLICSLWKEEVEQIDFVSLYLFQRGKELRDYCYSVMLRTPNETANAFLEILKEGGIKESAVIEMAEFMFEHRDSIPKGVFNAFYKLTLSRNAFQAAEVVKKCTDFISEQNDIKTTQNHTIEDFCYRHFNESTLDKVLKEIGLFDSDLSKVKYKNSDDLVPPFIVKCAIAPYMGLMKERPEPIKDYERDYLNVHIISEADKVSAELESESLISVMRPMDGIVSKYYLPQILLPIGRFCDGHLINELISAMREWGKWDEYGNEGRSAIIVAKGAILLNESREAMLYAKENGYQRVYKKIREISKDKNK